MPTPGQGSSRVGGLDAARGAAMLLVCLSHFSDACFADRPEAASLWRSIRIVTLLASPTFVIVSGLLVGLLAGPLDERKAELLRQKLAWRGFLLLTAVHALLLLGFTPVLAADESPLRVFFITDTIGLSLLANTLLAYKLRAGTRAVLGVALIAASALVLPFVPVPVGTWLHVAKDVLLGPWGAGGAVHSFPLLPWMGLHLSSTALGTLMRRQERSALATQTARLGGLLLLAGAACGIALLALRMPAAAARSPGQTLAHFFLSPVDKLPPSPAYFAFYGGGALLVVAACLWASEQRLASAVRSRLELSGRCSLAAFVQQHLLYYGVLNGLRLSPGRWWPLLFMATLLVQWPLLVTWDRRGWNRVLNPPWQRTRPAPGGVSLTP